MKRIFCALCLLSAVAYALAAFAQRSGYEPTTSEFPLLARFQIVQNSRSIKETYLLDLYTGRTWQMVDTPNRPKWEQLDREKHSLDNPTGRTVSYQMSVSGKTARGVYLLNVDTGATWVLFRNKEGKQFWGVIANPK